MTDARLLKPYSFFRDNKFDILEAWQKEVRSNPHFSKEPFSQNTQFMTHAQQFFSQILDTLEKTPKLQSTTEHLEPLLRLWHSILKEQSEMGFGTKDIAMLIFSFKSTCIAFFKARFKNTEFEYQPELDQLHQILDLLGLLTFELYTAEKDRLINQKDQQIQYIQEHHFKEKFSTLIGESPQMAAVYKAMGLILENDVTVLLEGESGTGKDLIATQIHQNSKRKSHPFITLNCGAIPKDLIESELFGHEKGAFTGALERRPGKFELANNGTLFLDEIGELPLEMQVKLLRVLQNQEIERVGGSEKIKIDVRIIAATNKNLQKEVDEKRFRLDLFYRINVYPISIPSLRERPTDIIPLAQHFIKTYCTRFNLNPKTLSDDAKTYLLQQRWPGNIRELENLIQRAIILAPHNVITRPILEIQPGKWEEIPLLDHITESTPSLPQIGPSDIVPLADMEKQAIEHALKIKSGNIQQTAKALGISRTTFYNKIKAYNIHLPPKNVQ